MSEAVQSLTDLLERASARRFLEAPPPEDLGIAEQLPFPFLGLVGQEEMKLGLLLGLINPNIGGVLLIGPRGTGKTTAVRSLTDLMPDVERSRCPYGCLPHEVEIGGIDAICPDCAKRYAQGEPLTYVDRVRLIDLPLNAQLDDVIGGLDERAAVHQRLRLRRGLLSLADQNILYVDEVNLLQDEIVDAILDAAAQGAFGVHRGPLMATYRSRFVLVGSMNPEEGRLRPQILDRFGLRVIVRGLADTDQRMEAYRRSVAFRTSPHAVIDSYDQATESAQLEISQARRQLAEVSLTEPAEKLGLSLIQQLSIDSLRAEITLFEAARAHAVADGRLEANEQDVRAVAPMSLRIRRSAFMHDFFEQLEDEEQELRALLTKPKPKRRKKK
ncbi:MAG TPA: ATP-binding protein [Anaerolineales bacterium]|jgi:magnesium chelatase subunit I